MLGVDGNRDSDTIEDDTLEDNSIQWNNLIFLPFHPTFRLIVMFSVVTKSVLGPIQSVYPIVFCWDVMDNDPYLSSIKFFYWYCADLIYGIDTFLHIVHRQVVDEALKREYLPKSALLILLDFAALIPFFRLMITDDCPPTQLWPNVLAFSESLILYRVVEYYNLKSTHSVWDMLVGFLLLLVCVLNCVTCFWLLLTYNGFCNNCKGRIFDWRSYFYYKLNETSLPYSTYVCGMVFVFTTILNQHNDDTKPYAINEFIGFDILVSASYLLGLYIVLPKIFAEFLLRLRRMFTAYPHVNRLVDETKRRNPTSKAHVSVENFYDVMWRKRRGITRIPEVITELPRYLRIEIRQDLGWALLYHSPILKKRSVPFKRYICDYITQDFKLPGERFFAGPQSQTNLYYLKSGIVQILSDDEGITPILSVTGGTIFGDTSFLLPPLNRKVVLKCLTYCEVMYLSRYDYLKGLHRYPEDRCEVFKLANERIKHAKTLYICKQTVRGLDRVEDEGIFWVKRRWWELSDFITKRKSRNRKNIGHCDLPPEETVYHCAKYIGQLVLCAESQLLTKSLFASVNFPWILVPNSGFVLAWRKLVFVTVVLVLLMYPPNITRPIIPNWFKFFQIWTDLIYAADIFVSLLTAMKQDSSQTNFVTVMFARCKTFYFNLDLLATIWVEYIAIVIGEPQLFYVSQFNRLIKIYIVFTDEFTHGEVRENPMISVFFRIAMTNFCFLYICSNLVYAISIIMPDVTAVYFFGHKYCMITEKGECDPGAVNVLGITLSWIMESMFFSEHIPRKLIDIYVVVIISLVSYMVCLYCKALFISSIYLKYREVTNFQNFVSNVKKYYKYYKIHKDLLLRLDRYLMCHWKYYQGADIMHPTTLKNEPYDIYWKVQGEVAEKIIGESRAFAGADPALIRDLAYASRCLILPKNSTLFLFGVRCRNVTWIVQGSAKCEYHSDDGELQKIYFRPGEMLSASSVFLGKTSMRTYSAYTDCEILYIKIADFYKIIKQYPNEWTHLDTCISEFAPVYNEMLDSYVKKHTGYQKKLRERIFHAKFVGTQTSIASSFRDHFKSNHILSIEHDFWTEPESDFMQYWMLFRAITVAVSIINASVQGGSGAVCRRILLIIGAFCDGVAWIDIVMKMFLAYYDHRGILIYKKQKCAIHYITRGFWLDIVGAVPWQEVIRKLMSQQSIAHNDLVINTFCKFAHIYLLVGYFNYISDLPTINFTYIAIIKWQIIMILVVFVASNYLMTFCIDFEFNGHGDLTSMKSLNTCWLPKMFDLKENPDEKQLHLLYAQSFNLCQCGLMGLNYEGFKVDRENLGVAAALVTLLLLYWYVTGYSLTLLVLNSRSNTLFQHGVSRLRNFLIAERVGKKLINQAVAHFIYWWTRTKGINIHHLTNERVGIVFRQDLSYYFFKKTFESLDTLLKGGEDLGRLLASASTQVFLLPGDEVVREMDLISSVFFVHRGKIVLKINNENVATLTKFQCWNLSIYSVAWHCTALNIVTHLISLTFETDQGSVFGPLESSVPRPVKVTAVAEGYADVLQLNIKLFQDVINDDIRKIIADHPTSNLDYMAVQNGMAENPYDTIQYILRGRKAILLPRMSEPMKACRGSLYARWLYLAWLVEPVCSAFIVIMLKTFKYHTISQFYWILALFDSIFLINFVCEFFTVKLVVVDEKCVYRPVGYRKFTQLGLYIDAVTLIVPLFSIPTGNINYQQIRVLRLRLLFDFHKHFCVTFKNKVSPILLKTAILLLFLHTFSCGWIIIACREHLPFKTPEMSTAINSTINFEEWVYPEDRTKGFSGCARVLDVNPNSTRPIFVVPRHWHDDYILAVTYVLLIFTQRAGGSIMALTIDQIYYKVIITFIIFIINIWLMSVAISFVYTRFRELYQYDYGVENLITYLRHSGLSPSLLDSVKKYTAQLWDRQRGNWLPELAQQAPTCLREDLLCALYIHHLDSPILFRDLPYYFKRQLAAKLKRIVIFPGKFIVQEGDVFPCMYFIHEGDVEKWYFDQNGESKMMSILTTNGYFGQIPGLFPNYPFEFSYYSRTVVDLVYLYLPDWQDLLDGYPDIKQQLYMCAKQLKKETTKLGKM